MYVCCLEWLYVRIAIGGAVEGIVRVPMEELLCWGVVVLRVGVRATALSSAEAEFYATVDGVIKAK